MSEILSINAETCPAIGYQKASVCVPVTVTPFAKPGDTKTFCCGEPVITEGIEPCEGKVGGSCSFTITQNICVAVPVEFGAVSKVGDTTVTCGETSSKDIRTNCSSENINSVDILDYNFK